MQRASGASQNRDRSGDGAWNGPGSAERRFTPHGVRGKCTPVRDDGTLCAGRPLGAAAWIWQIGRSFERVTMTDESTSDAGRDFIRDIVAADLAAGKHTGVVTRFPPEPNGYLHLGHAKSICLNFGIAEEFGGRCHLRFDDTNPTKEEQEYIDAIQRDVRWLGFDWGEHLHFASDYFEQLYAWAQHLIRAGKAYVDDQTPEEIRLTRGTLTEAGQNSPFRDRSVEENLDLFARMRAGEFPNGARVLRAKIDMASGNINLRDPVLYRILHAHHPRTGEAWTIYPSYDFAHGQSDAIEHITHSICTLEFEDHRPLYDWFLDNLPVPSRPRQYEFARLNVTYTLLSKRVLTELVRGGHVSGWDDPRMPTLAGLQRRGIPPEALRDFVRRIGVAKANSTVDLGMFDFAVRETLNRTAPRRMAVLRPLKVVIENYPEGQVEQLEAVNHPDDPAQGTRTVPFARELYIERDDFMEDPPKKFFRLAPGREVRLRYGYFITCREAVKDAAGEVMELRCTYDPATRGGNAPDGRKVKATIHWVSAAHAVPAEVRLYDTLFATPQPEAANFAAQLNPKSLETLTGCVLEPALAADNAEGAVQFERQGYFCRDKESAPDKLVFNRTVGLRDSYAKLAAG
jgi:glutaminyl-tRNA synthetase